MLDQHRDWFKKVEIKIANIFAIFPITPNQYTAISIIFALVCAYQLFVGGYWLALAFFVLAAGMDFVDGAVARKKNLSSPRGAYWDTVADRYVEVILLFGMLFVGLPDLYLPGFAWVFLALFGSIMTTYAKAAAKEKGLLDVELKGGLMSRGERLIFLVAILVFLNYSKIFAIHLFVLLSILVNITALQRIAKALSGK
ncbi:MAG: CDP-alcohol phosphatidyltransferase family protein [Candidatus Paceibacterota bacterium]